MINDEERREVARRLREPFDVVGQGRYVAPSRNRTLDYYWNTWETDTQLQILREIRACNQRVESLRSDVAWSTLILAACLLGLCVIVWIACF